jgi:serine protease Do
MRAARHLLALLIVGAMPHAHAASTAAATDQVAVVVARVKPAVVQIITVRPPDPPADTGGAVNAADERPVMSVGSGFLIDARGYIATNRHVIDKAVAVFVETQDGVRSTARIIGVTFHADIALLRIDPRPGLTTVAFGDSDKMQVGDTVIAIGSPFGFQASVSTGIVSATNRDIMESPFDDYIQTDAAINHGNSGGPLFNLAGEVIGMNSILFAPGNYSGSVGLGFAIPSSSLKFVLDRMEKYNGHVNAGMLPIRTQPVTWMLAQAIGARGTKGALVAGLADGGDETMEGQVRPGDVILSFNGTPVLDPRDLARKAAVMPVGDVAVLDMLRGETHVVVDVKVQPYPEETLPAPMIKARILGLDLAMVPDQGVTVIDVDPQGTAADSSIQKGDVILQVQQSAVADPTQALRLMEVQTALKRHYAGVLVKRDGIPTWIAVAVPE